MVKDFILEKANEYKGNEEVNNRIISITTGILARIMQSVKNKTSYDKVYDMISPDEDVRPTRDNMLFAYKTTFILYENEKFYIYDTSLRCLGISPKIILYVLVGYLCELKFDLDEIDFNKRYDYFDVIDEYQAKEFISSYKHNKSILDKDKSDVYHGYSVYRFINGRILLVNTLSDTFDKSEYLLLKPKYCHLTNFVDIEESLIDDVLSKGRKININALICISLPIYCTRKHLLCYDFENDLLVCVKDRILIPSVCKAVPYDIDRILKLL